MNDITRHIPIVKGSHKGFWARAREVKVKIGELSLKTLEVGGELDSKDQLR